MEEKPVAIITGGSSGIGLETVKKLIKTHTVYELSRRETKAEGYNHVRADVTDAEGIERTVSEIYNKEKRIDVLICCAGFGISGAVEFTKSDDAKKQLDVNFFGTVNTVKAVIPYMRKQKRGRIICISSVAAVAAIPFQTYYSVSKACINSFVCALRGEVSPYGISVCAVMPGDIHTGFTSAREKECAGDKEYGGRITRSVSQMENDETHGASPEYAGLFISRIACKKRVKPLYTIGFNYKMITFLLKILPASLSVKLIAGIYAK